LGVIAPPLAGAKLIIGFAPVQMILIGWYHICIIQSIMGISLRLVERNRFVIESRYERDARCYSSAGWLTLSFYLNFARIFTNNAKAFTSVGSIMRSLLEKIQVSIIF